MGPPLPVRLFKRLNSKTKTSQRQKDAIASIIVNDEPSRRRNAFDIGRRPDPFAPPANLTLLSRVVSILILDRQISATDAVCIALTCKTLHRTGVTFSRLVRQAVVEDGPASILHRLEPTLPGRFLCLEGPRLVHLHPAPGYSRSGEMAHYCCNAYPARSRGTLPPTPRAQLNFGYSRFFRLLWCDARLATSYALYGPGHGIPLSELGMTHLEPRQASLFIKHEESWRALTTPGVENNLLLSCTRKFSNQNGGTLASFVQLFAHTSLIICPHYRCTLVFPQYGIKNVKKARIRGGCTYCHTDWEIKSRIDAYGIFHQDNAWSITLTTWHDVGPCRVLGEPKWESFGRWEAVSRAAESVRLSWKASHKPDSLLKRLCATERR